MKRLALMALVIGALAITASGFKPMEKVFYDTYKIKEGSAIEKLDCMICHVKPKGGKLNSYGLDLEAALKAKNTKKLTPAILADVENLDSNKNGVKNIDEIKKDQNPGG